MINFVEREMTDAEFARMSEGFNEHALEHGNPIETGERHGFVALDGDTFIGCSSGLAYKHEQGYSKWCYLTDLFVEKPYRKHGVGAQLLARLESRFRALGVDYIYTWTAGYEAPGFYKKQGSQVFTEMEEWYHSGHARVGLRKRLASRSPVAPVEIVPLTVDDQAWLSGFMKERWGDDQVVAHGVTFVPSALPGFAAMVGQDRQGAITYHIADQQCEIVTLDSLHSGRGVGTALIEAVKSVAREAGCRRLWLITTNDNLHALGFYQRRGFSLVQINRNALDRSRQLKPTIPQTGVDGIPLRDELELEILLND